MNDTRLFHRIVRTSGFAFAGNAGAKLLGLLHWVLLYFVLLGDAGYGRFAFVLAYVGIFSGLAEGGVSGILVRQLNRISDSREKGGLFAGALLLLSLQGIVFWLISLFALLAVPSYREIEELNLVLLYSTVVLFAPHSACYGVFRSCLDIRVPVLVDLARGILFLIALVPGTPIVELGAILFVWWLLLFLGVCAVALFSVRRLPPVWSGAWTGMASLFRESWPLFFTRLATVAYYRIDQVMLRAFFDPAQLGWYAGAVKWTESLNLIPAVLLEGVYPAISRLWNESREAFDRAVRRVWLVFVAISGEVVLGLTLLVPMVLSCERASSLAPAEPAFLLLAGAEGLIFLNLFLFQVLIAAGRQRNLVSVTGSMVCANIALNLFFFTQVFPGAGHVGASVATLLTEALGVGFQFVLMTRFLSGTLDWRSHALSCVLLLGVGGGLFVRFYLVSESAIGPVLHVGLLLAWTGGMLWLLRNEFSNLREFFSLRGLGSDS